MIVVKVGSKEIVVNNSLELIKDNLSSYKIVDGKRRPKIVYVKLTADETFYTTWLSAKIRKNSLDLFHLETPEEGKGFGRLGLAVFWAMSKEANKEEFALRFGGGKNSENFLKSLGFPPSSIKRVQDEHTEGKYSVVVGNIDDRGEEIGDTFSSISVEYFPTEFFQAKKIN